ncbi:molybdopterin-dependent oxidoreductase [Actinoallomurus sp. NBC_01490]|uniref:molybdopterin-dependent oxidoreductase n=1 Tax=Actinoallomurus sp. NBC_01490 TaxID=2903557 RepID=UPI002E36FB2E|nr:molybdopterin cofactor-binding domain-containing protein [Actinoallomurus sp. NBC_01490]
MEPGFTVTVNGVAREVAAGPERSLLEVLREELGITGPKLGCGEGMCGACTVLLGRRAVTACTTPAGEAAGHQVTTVEGLAEDGLLHPVQQAWMETGAMQCGYCTPGWLTGCAALLARVPHPDDARIDAELAGHLCRCCTYPRIRAAVHRAAELMEQPESLEPVPVPAAEPAVAAGAATRPWDLVASDPDAFLAGLPEGLVSVAERETAPGVLTTSTRAWLHVGPDGVVTAFTGKVEAGQGTRGALSLLVAEELRVPPGAVRVLMGDTGVSPFDMGTFGSRSIPDAAPLLCRAAAAARRVLREAAAQRFGLAEADVTLAEGMAVGPDGAPSASFGELVTGMRRVEQARADEQVTDPDAWRRAGRPARSAAAGTAVTGSKRFPSNLAVPGMLHGCVLRAPAYGARLLGLDLAAAQAMPGIQVVRDGDFVGVVAPTAREARAAVTAIAADWELTPQPGPAELEAYLRAHPAEGQGHSAPYRHAAGDVDAALASGPLRLEATYKTAYVAHVPLEPRVALARWESGRLTVWTGTSTPFRARGELAEALGLDEAAVQVIVPDYGGGFGGKHGAAAALEAARLARAAGGPVKVAWSREEEFRWGYLRPAAVIDVAASADAAGQLTGWSFTNINSGRAGIDTPYRVPSRRIAYQPADSPLPQGSYRALAATANSFARESHMDEMARLAGADPLVFRLDHLDDERLATVLRRAADRIGWDRHDQQPAGHGLGLACGWEKGGRVATAAEVRVDDDGRLHVLRLVTAFDCGAVIDPANLANQVEGATVMGLGGALFEQVDFADGVIRNASLSQYRVPRLPDVPPVEAILIDRPDQPSAGGGETPLIAVAPALANAIRAATGTRIRSMPLAPNGKVSRA